MAFAFPVAARHFGFPAEARALFRLLDEPFFATRRVAPAFGRFAAEGPISRPAIDLSETEGGYQLVAEVPGYRRDALKIEFAGEDQQTLVISGSRAPPKAEVAAEAAPAATESGAAASSAQSSSAPAEKTSIAESVAPHEPTSWLSERSSATFSRSFRLPHRIDVEAVKANLRDGVLTLELPKVAQVGPRAVTID